jgi:hypothetical protein
MAKQPSVTLQAIAERLRNAKAKEEQKASLDLLKKAKDWFAKGQITQEELYEYAARAEKTNVPSAIEGIVRESEFAAEAAGAERAKQRYVKVLKAYPDLEQGVAPAEVTAAANAYRITVPESERRGVRQEQLKDIRIARKARQEAIEKPIMEKAAARVAARAARQEAFLAAHGVKPSEELAARFMAGQKSKPMQGLRATKPTMATVAKEMAPAAWKVAAKGAIKGAATQKALVKGGIGLTAGAILATALSKYLFGGKDNAEGMSPELQMMLMKEMMETQQGEAELEGKKLNNKLKELAIMKAIREMGGAMDRGPMLAQVV